MRKALALGTALLLLVLALEQRRLARGAGGAPVVTGAPAAPGRVDVIVASKGRLLPSGRYGGGPEHFDDVMRIGDRVLSVAARRSGLRVAWLAPDLTVEKYRSYDVAESADDVAALRGRAERSPVGTVLALASAGRIEPRGEDAARRIAELDALGARLGSRVRPFDATPCSWALLSIRVPGGWRRLAEAFSFETGVVLPFTLERERGLYPDHEAETFFGAIEEEVELQLFREIGTAEIAHAPVQFLVVRRDEGGFAHALAANLSGTNRPELATVRWEDVRLGAHPELRCELAVRKTKPSRDRGAVRFVIVVDDEVAGAKLVEPADPSLPSAPWRVDLAAWSGRVVSLELRAEAEPSVRDRQAIWQRPVVAFGASR